MIVAVCIDISCKEPPRQVDRWAIVSMHISSLMGGTLNVDSNPAMFPLRHTDKVIEITQV